MSLARLPVIPGEAATPTAALRIPDDGLLTSSPAGDADHLGLVVHSVGGAGVVAGSGGSSLSAPARVPMNAPTAVCVVELPT